ncbi:MBL fold metallo-hydrolase [Desertibaculum subflavum]|uniref:MBL fold metallo-hydrolase n=1 Tax=Desertibaculum subflavum TaxID=2268458 RepID=UPI000E66824E
MSVQRVGDITIDKVVDLAGMGFVTKQLLPDLEPDVLEANADWLCPDHWNREKNRFNMSIHSWVVRNGRQTILIDTCLGNDKERPDRPFWHRRQGDFLQQLRAVGVQPEDVTHVCCTHLHVDHVGWNTQLKDGRWVPTFPNAKYLFGRTEYAHWAEEQKKPGANVGDGAFLDSVVPIVDAGLAVMVDKDYDFDRAITLEEFPGHTPGSLVIGLQSKGEEAHFIGDIMHHPIQVYRPGWSSQFCWDPKMSASSRRRVLELCVERKSLLLPAHFGASGCGHIHPHQGNFRIDWAKG